MFSAEGKLLLRALNKNRITTAVFKETNFLQFMHLFYYQNSQVKLFFGMEMKCHSNDLGNFKESKKSGLFQKQILSDDLDTKQQYSFQNTHILFLLDGFA